MKTLPTMCTTLSECAGLILVGAHQSCFMTSLPLWTGDRKSNESLRSREGWPITSMAKTRVDSGENQFITS